MIQLDTYMKLHYATFLHFGLEIHSKWTEVFLPFCNHMNNNVKSTNAQVNGIVRFSEKTGTEEQTGVS